MYEIKVLDKMIWDTGSDLYCYIGASHQGAINVGMLF